jgi:Domain of unknown function (DUF4118)
MKISARINLALTIAGPVIVLLFGWATSSTGDGDSDGLALANVALLMAVVTVAVALVSWTAGVTTSVVAALTLNWYHTEPVGTFRVTSSDDLTSVLILGALGICVSAVTALRMRNAARVGRAAGAAEARREFEALAQSTHPVHDLWHAALATTSPELALVSARLTDVVPDGLPVVARRPWTADPEQASLVLPATGAALALHHEGSFVVLTPREGIGPLTIDRRAAEAFADTFELAARIGEAT